MSASPSATGAPTAPKHVRVTVRTIANAVPCAGRVFTNEPVVFDAAPADIRDLMAAADRLLITWPEGYVMPNGLEPAKAVIAPAAPASLTSADRVAIAEKAAADAVARVTGLTRAIGDLESQRAAEKGAARLEIATLNERIASLVGSANSTEVAASADAQALAEAVREHELVLHAVKQEHRAALDTARAEHAAELETAQLEIERLAHEVDRLTAALDAVKPAKSKAGKGATPAPVEPDPSAPTG